MRVTSFIFAVIVLVGAFAAVANAQQYKYSESQKIHDLLDGILAKLADEREKSELAFLTDSAAVDSQTNNYNNIVKQQEAERARLQDQINTAKGKAASSSTAASAAYDRTRTEAKLINKIKVLVENLNGNQLGKDKSTPADNCEQIQIAQETAGTPFVSGVYWIQPPSFKDPVQAYCKIEKDGGWTLVWSNIRGTTNKPTTNMKWATAINTDPLITGTISASLTSFTVYTGLAKWDSLSPSGKIRYEWSPNVNQATPTHVAECDYSLVGDKYILAVRNCKLLQGNVMPAMFHYHAGRPFTTIDNDNDENEGNCASYYSGTPFWYGTCWSGSINGGGQNSGNNYLNGAYWYSSDRIWGTTSGTGAGNGWIYVR